MADMTVRFYSEVTIGGEKKTIEHTNSVAGLTQIYDQTLELTSTKCQVFAVAAAEAGASLADFTFMYLENLDSSTAIDFVIEHTSGTQVCWLKIPAGKFVVLWNRSLNADDDATAGSAPTFVNMDLIEAKTPSSTAKLRIVVADDT